VIARKRRIVQICQDYGLLAIYLFGSRADDGLAVLSGRPVTREGSDLDVGVVFRRGAHSDETDVPVLRLGSLQVELEEVFAPLRVDLVPLQRVDALFQFEAIDGHRVAASDDVAADYYELYVMRRAAELLPIQRRMEEEEFGASTA
jgi:predicted nucleotidyltransferase